ncbi:unnamed protein product [Adineta ricciae]|uniref:Uncharacterized protein n=1 Tax=Adineta ricciae TaxID=249248 RepID=A0A815BYG9_ADIRI|nr:unnamed protein product [Adineta ricciae]CAF1605205.1 unnamed protein product [Adineta ricciae]
MDGSNRGDNVLRESEESLEILVMMNPGDIGMTIIDSGETNSEQNSESQDAQSLIVFGSARPVDMTSNLSTHTLSFPASQPMEVEPHDTGKVELWCYFKLSSIYLEPAAEVPFAAIPRLFGPAEDFIVQFATQVQTVSPAMDLDLYLATRPYDRETTAELLGKYIYDVVDTNLLFLIFKVESPDLLPVEVVEMTVDEEPHIQADIDQIPGEHVVGDHVQNNTENEGINNVPEITVSPPEAPGLIEDGHTNESSEVEPLPIVGPVGNSEQIDTADIDSPVLHHPGLQQLLATPSPPVEAMDQTPTVTATTENSQLSITTTAHLGVLILPLARERRSKSSSVARRFHFNDRRRNSNPETKLVYQTNRSE